jgi:hypothetical protein
MTVSIDSIIAKIDSLDAPKIEKITRASFLYMDPKSPATQFAQCATCVQFIDDKKRCVLHGRRDVIDGDDSCGLYSRGDPSTGKDPLGLVTADESGLVSRQVRCENCMFFDPGTEPRKHCDLYTQLNRMMPNLFDLDRYVNERGCCNAQTPGKRNPKVFGPIGPIQ